MWDNNSGTNSYRQQLTDPLGTLARRGDKYDEWVSDFLGGGDLGDVFGGQIGGGLKIASLQPRKMWEGVRDLHKPITMIADLWS